jgi:hypothetical protein
MMRPCHNQSTPFGLSATGYALPHFEDENEKDDEDDFAQSVLRLKNLIDV